MREKRLVTDPAEREEIIAGLEQVREESLSSNPHGYGRQYRIAWTIIQDTLDFKPYTLFDGIAILRRRTDLPIVVRSNYGLI